MGLFSYLNASFRRMSGCLCLFFCNFREKAKICFCGDDDEDIGYFADDSNDFRNPEDRESYMRSMQKTIKSHKLKAPDQKAL
ncbi:hypothetical protein L596_019209 [Steinernema carpocapsae]|uniref:Uncharacterized protein n=1 Tax=Steinernema carpocapsae TaxID=34508 RepID=A0A4U5MQQ0_STECR|nr:hypothetical protein L596_019209 [Steinernema carpocapsae]